MSCYTSNAGSCEWTPTLGQNTYLDKLCGKIGSMEIARIFTWPLMVYTSSTSRFFNYDPETRDGNLRALQLLLKSSDYIQRPKSSEEWEGE